MKKQLTYRGINISYSVNGSGEPLIFLHGYLESKEIWKDFKERFTDDYTVLCIDLPGHGESGILGAIHEMDEMAAVVNEVLLQEKIEKSVLFGHSMGGYVVMAFANLFPDKLLGYCLFHSTCFADDEEKKNNRDREIGLVKCGKKNQIIHTNIPKGFAHENLELMEKEVIRAKDIALATSEDGIVALLRGMKERKDHSDTLRKATPKPLIVWGKKDNYISDEVFRKLVDMAPTAEILVLGNSGHMGFIEEPDEAYHGILDYMANLKK